MALALSITASISGCMIANQKVKSTATEAPIKGTQASSLASLELVDHRGQKHSVQDALKVGPVAVIFYRGHW